MDESYQTRSELSNSGRVNPSRSAEDDVIRYFRPGQCPSCVYRDEDYPIGTESRLWMPRKGDPPTQICLARGEDHYAWILLYETDEPCEMWSF